MSIGLTPLADMRQSYERAELIESNVAASPVSQLQAWLQEAIAQKVSEPNAMTVATVGANNRPSTRIVLIKHLDAQGLVWFTNYQSKKGQELAANPFAALQFHWVPLEREVRIEGRVEKVDATMSDAYFASRPVLSQIAAIASPQSTRVEGRDALQAKMDAAHTWYGDKPVRPAHWGGYRLVPTYFEFWQGRRNRLHDRIVYEKKADGVWEISRLAP